MARGQQLLIPLVFLWAVAAPAEDTPQNPLLPRQKRVAENGANSPEFENVRKAIEALSPEQRRRFQENFARWVNLSPEEKRALREREEFRRKRIAQDIDRAIQDSGLQLQGERRVQFAKRYAEERRKVEEQLRREMDEKRQPRLKEIVAKLKEEFSAESPATNPSPSATTPTAPTSPP